MASRLRVMKNLKRFSVVCDRLTTDPVAVDAESHFQTANAHLRTGRLDAALFEYSQALAKKPDHVPARFNRANALIGCGRHPEAVEEYRVVAQRDPDFPGLGINLGVALVSLGRFEEAVEAFGEATRRQPGVAQAWNNLGGILGQLERFEEAISALRQAVVLAPNDPDATLNLVRALHRERKQESIVVAERATRTWPRRPDAWVALGDARLLFGDPVRAIQAYDSALALDSAAVDASVNYGLACLQSSKLDEATQFFVRYLERNPAEVDAWGDFAIVLATGGFLEQSLGCFRRALEIKPQSPAVHSNLMVIMSYGTEATPAAMLAEAENWVANNVSGPLFPAYTPVPHDRRRIGFVSGDFRQHPVGRFVELIVAAHDRSRFEIFGYSTYRDSDPITKKIQASVDGWRNVSDLTDQELASQIRDDEIDILIDLSGHTPMNRLPAFARRLAPVQATWLGYFGTLAMSEMDYILADSILLPESEEQFYRERPARMPNGLYFLQKPTAQVQPGPPPALRNGYPTFGCFNTLTKITKETVALWAQVLRALPESRMILNRHALAAKSARALYYSLFEAEGIDPNRLEMRTTQTRDDYFRAYQDVDVMLDTTPFGGGTTSSEALWMGVPVVSLSSDRFPGRMTESVLNTVGLAELVPTDESDFVRLAGELVSDLPRLTAIRSTLRTKVETSRLCDVDAYTRELESVFEWMWANRK